MLTGNPTVFGIDPFSESATPIHPLGTKGVTTDGRIFRFTKNGAVALTTGRLCIAADLIANHEDRAFATAGVVGDKIVSIAIGGTAITANQYDEGYLVIIDDTGEGHTHQIVRHGTSTTGSENVSFTITPGLKEATTTSTTVTLVRNIYSGVLVSDTSQSDIPVGVTPIAVTASYYFWLQAGGIAGVYTDTTATVQGQMVTIGATDNGAVTVHDSVAEPIIGIAPVGVTATATEECPVFLTLDR